MILPFKHKDKESKEDRSTWKTSRTFSFFFFSSSVLGFENGKIGDLSIGFDFLLIAS